MEENNYWKEHFDTMFPKFEPLTNIQNRKHHSRGRNASIMESVEGIVAGSESEKTSNDGHDSLHEPNNNGLHGPDQRRVEGAYHGENLPCDSANDQLKVKECSIEMGISSEIDWTPNYEPKQTEYDWEEGSQSTNFFAEHVKATGESSHEIRHRTSPLNNLSPIQPEWLFRILCYDEQTSRKQIAFRVTSLQPTANQIRKIMEYGLLYGLPRTHNFFRTVCYTAIKTIQRANKYKTSALHEPAVVKSAINNTQSDELTTDGEPIGAECPSIPDVNGGERDIITVQSVEESIQSGDGISKPRSDDSRSIKTRGIKAIFVDICSPLWPLYRSLVKRCMDIPQSRTRIYMVDELFNNNDLNVTIPICQQIYSEIAGWSHSYCADSFSCTHENIVSRLCEELRKHRSESDGSIQTNQSIEIVMDEDKNLDGPRDTNTAVYEATGCDSLLTLSKDHTYCYGVCSWSTSLQPLPLSKCEVSSGKDTDKEIALRKIASLHENESSILNQKPTSYKGPKRSINSESSGGSGDEIATKSGEVCFGYGSTIPVSPNIGRGEISAINNDREQIRFMDELPLVKNRSNILDTKVDELTDLAITYMGKKKSSLRRRQLFANSTVSNWVEDVLTVNPTMPNNKNLDLLRNTTYMDIKHPPVMRAQRVKITQGESTEVSGGTRIEVYTSSTTNSAVSSPENWNCFIDPCGRLNITFSKEETEIISKNIQYEFRVQRPVEGQSGTGFCKIRKAEFRRKPRSKNDSIPKRELQSSNRKVHQSSRTQPIQHDLGRVESHCKGNEPLPKSEPPREVVEHVHEPGIPISRSKPMGHACTQIHVRSGARILSDDGERQPIQNTTASSVKEHGLHNSRNTICETRRSNVRGHDNSIGKLHSRSPHINHAKDDHRKQPQCDTKTRTAGTHQSRRELQTHQRGTVDYDRRRRRPCDNWRRSDFEAVSRIVANILSENGSRVKDRSNRAKVRRHSILSTQANEDKGRDGDGSKSSKSSRNINELSWRVATTQISTAGMGGKSVTPSRGTNSRTNIREVGKTLSSKHQRQKSRNLIISEAMDETKYQPSPSDKRDIRRR